MSDSLKDALQKLKAQGIGSSLQEPKNPGLVYSTDQANQERCARCRQLAAACTCEPEAAAPESGARGYKFVAILRIEKQGRGGKTVTVIDGLPKNELFLRELTTKLKKQCGSGGTYLMDGRDGVIEIQGEKRELVRKLLEKSGIRSKG
jgi:translation initiation factor 1